MPRNRQSERIKNPPLPRKRNFIPSGEETPTEKALIAARLERLPSGRGANFTPGPDFVEGVKPDPEAESAHRDAARTERSKARKQREWSGAVDRLMKGTPAQLVPLIQTMPTAYQNLYLLAEAEGLNREEIMNYFPHVGPSGRKAWAEFLPAQPEQEEEAPASTHPEGPSRIAPIEASVQGEPQIVAPKSASEELAAAFEAARPVPKLTPAEKVAAKAKQK